LANALADLAEFGQVSKLGQSKSKRGSTPS
jgi:hypothetical protein